MMPQNRLVVLSQGHTGVCTQERERDSECQIQNRAGDADGVRDLNLRMVLHCACINAFQKRYTNNYLEQSIC